MSDLIKDLLEKPFDQLTDEEIDALAGHYENKCFAEYQDEIRMQSDGLRVVLPDTETMKGANRFEIPGKRLSRTI